MQAYLDNSATTRCSERARDIMVKVLMEDYGNPSSLHTMGMVAEGYIRRAKEQIAKTLKAEEKEIYFTSGGPESNNLAIIGTALHYDCDRTCFGIGCYGIFRGAGI